MADKLDIQSAVFPERRKRGIYEVAVYKTDITLSGKFNSIPWEKLNVPAGNILWNESLLFFKVQDQLKGINEDIHVLWNDSNLVFMPQSPGQTPMEEAFVTAIPLLPETTAKGGSFSIKFSLNGSEQLLFTAAARENKIEMRSAWPDPGFTGIKLPDTRVVKDSGFTATWKYMNRAVPQVWKNTFYQLPSSQIGADLLVTVDSYDKTERSVKYALLCIMLTFAAFFLVETIYKKSLHLVQYGLAGLALVLFYTLLLSISEYTGFNLAYLIAGSATIGLVGWYVGSILKSSKLALFITKALAQFTGSMIAADSKYDRYKKGTVTFNAQEENGYQLYKVNCASCHPEPLFTDYSFRNIGLPLDNLLTDYGRMRITGKSEDSLKFKVPTLRNTYISSNYMHDGRFNTLQQCINHYRTNVKPGPTLDPLLINGISLTNAQATDLVVFLRTLTDSTLLRDPRFSKPN